MLTRLNFTHSLCFLLLALGATQLGAFSQEALPVLCIFLVMSIGTSHGALDHLKGRKVSDALHVESIVPFYVLYIALAVMTFCVWLISPAFLWASFLAVAAYHFGKEDAEFAVTERSPLHEALFLFKGCAVIAGPLLLSRTETLEIFLALNLDLSSSPLIRPEFLVGVLGLSLGSSLLLGRGQPRQVQALLVSDLLAVILLNVALHPLLAFTLYFCLLHSVRHSLSLMLELGPNLKAGFGVFVRKALPLTLVVAVVFLSSFQYIRAEYALSDAVSKVVFVGLAALTFPHILLEYLFERFSDDGSSGGVKSIEVVRRDSRPTALMMQKRPTIIG